MPNRTAVTAILLSTALAAPAFGQSAGWHGEGELGFSTSSGNTDTENLNTRLGLSRDAERWRHTVSLEALRAEADGVTTAERYVLAGKSDYKIADPLYAFASLRHERDEFASFEEQTTVSVGVGDRFIENGRTTLDLSAGLGLRTSKVRATGRSEDDTILRLGGLLNHQFNQNVSFGEELLVEAGGDNTYVESATSLTAKINEDLAARFGFLAKHNTDVTAGQDKTDTLTTVSLVYSF